MLPTKKQLLSMHPEIEKRIVASQVVEDVMERKITGGIGSTKIHVQSSLGKGAEGAGIIQNRYLPKGSLEPEMEYLQRLSMTPFFPETPHIVADRIGAIFAEQPELDGTDKEQYENIEKNFTTEGKSFQVTAAECAAWMQRIGFCGIFLDRKKLDADTKARIEAGTFSKADEEKLGLSDPQATLYRPNQILDFEWDKNGLAWVKVIEFYAERAAWNEPLSPVKIVRKIDRQFITSWKINAKDEVSEEGEPVAVDPKLGGRCPFVFVSSPIDAWCCLGSSMLIEAAEADVSSTRLASDIVWDLFILGQPIVKWHTFEEEKTLATGAGRYVRLKPGTGTREREDVDFAQMDSAGIDLQIAMHDRLKALGRTLAGRQGDAVIQDQPKEVSGVARAWEFKTGEERVLFLITFALQSAFDQVFNLEALMKGLDPNNIKVKFNKKFDLGAPKDALDVSERILNIVTPLGMKTARKVALRKVVDQLGPRTDEEDKAIDVEIETAANKEQEPPEPLDDENKKPGFGFKKKEIVNDD